MIANDHPKFDNSIKPHAPHSDEQFNPIEEIKSLGPQQEGASFEEWVWADAMNNRVLLIKQHPEVKWFVKGGAKVVDTAWADYIAYINGFTFTFDCKSTRIKITHRLNLDQGARKDSWKRYAQFDKLVKAWEYGMPAFYLVRWVMPEDVVMYMVDGSMTFPLKLNYQDGIHLGWGDVYFPAMLKALNEV